MRYINNNKFKNPKTLRSDKKQWQRALSFIIVCTLVINTMYSGGLFALFNFSTFMSVKAEEDVLAYSPTYNVSEFSGTEHIFSDTPEGFRKFVDYCYYYSVNENNSFCAAHISDTLKINFPTLAESYQFMGLGNPYFPFAGKVTFIASGGHTNISLSRGLFTHVSTDARITDNSGNYITLEFTRNSSASSSPILADHVYPGTNPADWRIEVASGNTNSFAGAIGQIETGASVVLSFNNSSSAAVSNTASGENDVKDVGELCGIMKTGSSLTVTDTSTSRTAVSSANGNAGSLVGKMEGTASLTLNSGYPAFTNVSVTSENGYAGGLVGDMTSSATISFSGLSSPLHIGGTVTGTTGAGGLFGHYTNSASTFDLKDYIITASVSADNCGGVFGVLENIKGASSNPLSLTIKNTVNAGTVNVSSGSTASEGHFGGIAGMYSTDDLLNSLVLDDLTVTATANASFGSFGGVIGYVEGAAYIDADDMNITASGTARGDSEGYFGGLVGKTSDTRGVFLDLGDITLTVNDSGGFTGGGIVGDFKNGVLRLSGVTDMSGAQSKKGGQLVGKNDNVLVYAIGTGTNGTSSVRDGSSNSITTGASGWSFKRSTNASSVDDLGTWGEVVRIADIEHSSNGVLTMNPANHTVTIKAANTSMATQTDLVRTALNIQLNNQTGGYDCLLFTNGSENTRSSLLGTTLSLTADLSFADTGITGFMRDGSDSVGTFTGTFNGGSHTITLAAGQAYGLTGSGSAVSSSTEGVGQIYAHPYNGLFAFIGNGTTGTGTVNSLTIAGNIDVHNTIDGMNIGGIAAVSHGNTTLNGITAAQTINYKEPAAVAGTKEAGKNIGGLIGLAGASDNGTIAVNGTNTISTRFYISGNYNTWTTLGAAIGKVTSPQFVINIAQTSGNKLTVSHTMSVDGNTTVGANADGGGLIGYITSASDYSKRVVNIKNLEFDDCTIVNKATSNGGGFLGYAWLDTDTTIDGLTVKDGTITNVSPNVGVMCYEATGRWKVNALTVTKMSLANAAGTSLGMLVNKMYTTDASGNVNGALYLDVLNSGYTLTGSNITLPGSIGIYDEIAAYSAPDVVAGGAGVISINMNSARNTGSALITTTGTYQNKISRVSSAGVDAIDDTKFANANSRYYYNLDKMSTSDAGQNLVLWSARKYAYTNIAGALPATTLKDNNLTGNANLSGLSYYPVAKAGNYTLNNLNVSFDYNGIYATAEDTFPTGLTTDGYKRDPGATGNVRNQHYLMHGGLFIDLPKGKTITVSGTSTLGGTFLEVDGYKAALINGTMNGNLNISGKLDLNGLVPKTTGNVLYQNGYLLINAISRPDSQLETVSVNISGLTASGYSSATLPVAKSLIGAADGRGFMFDFSGIKLDGRKADVSDSTTNNALNTAYGTTRSIFSDAILFYSINTDRNAEMTYNFTYDDDWGTGTGSTAKRNVTYGNEISHTVEYWDSEGYKSRQSKYSGTPKNYTNPTGANTEYDFLTTVFLPYVREPYDTTADHSVKYYRELKVNYLLEIESKGCGTYNDPYIIESPDQLSAIAAFIKSGNTTSIYLNSITLPKYDAAKHHGVELNSTGDRWCTDKDGSGYHATYDAKTGGGFSATGCTDWPDDDARYYLASAYYKIENNITLGSDFVGLGGTEANYAFRGVIVGEKDDNGAPKYTITNKSECPFIYVSNGSVVKDVSIVVNFSTGIGIQQDNNSSTEAYFGYDYGSSNTCNFYGGIIGEIMGGDNIIDNSYVTYSNTTITLKGSSATIIPVGGYVGVVVFGGLIFKNMAAAKTTIGQTGLSVSVTGESYNLADNSDEEAWAAIYVNPIVGRVINGYAVNETGGNAKKADGTSVKQFSTSEDGHYHDDDNSTRTGVVLHTLKNGKKHYTIADIDPDVNDYAKLDVTSIPTSTSADGNINVPNAQALFVLSLITQSCAGTAQTVNGNGEGSTHTDVTVENSRTTDPETGDVTIYKTRTTTDIDTSLSNYVNSLSYGINTTVYGMSHDADYDEVGTDDTPTADNPETEEDETVEVTDYTDLASYDTAANTALPYIISHYTVGGLKIESTSVEGEPEVEEHSTAGSIATEPFTATTTDDIDGKELIISCTGRESQGKQNTYYYLNASTTAGIYGLKAETNKNNATKMKFEKQSNGKYTISFSNGGTKTYIGFYSNNRNLRTSTTKYEFIITITDGKWIISTDAFSGNNQIGLRNESEFCGNDNYNFTLYLYTPGSTVTTTTITTTVTNTNSIIYPARCVTSTVGYYDINLTNETDNYVYQLPDSYRGLGCVGIYDTINNVAASGNTPATFAKDNKYSMKVDAFDGKGSTIDQDIYLNKFLYDNYFNVLHAGVTQYLGSDTQPFKGNGTGGVGLSYNHGIGLFDSIITKNDSSEISDFILTGSLNTEVYNNDYSAENKEYIGVFTNTQDNEHATLWHSAGGVCGWSTNGIYVNFKKIQMNDFTVNGSNFVGGLLGFSGIGSKTVKITAQECSADNITLKMTSASNVGSTTQTRNAMGAFVGKVQEGAVVVYGTEYGVNNSDLTNLSQVKIKFYGFGDNNMNYYVSTGGLVGFAGHGCQAYDMKVISGDTDITIGKSDVGFSGGIVGVMQPFQAKSEDATAIFKNCAIENINIQGNMAGGIYGGKWAGSDYVPYRIELDNCKVLGGTSHNQIIGGEYAGGLVGNGLVYTRKSTAKKDANIVISNCKVSNYNIRANAGKYSGGFVGYCDSRANSVTCYIHDSSVENCVLGIGGKDKDYCGGSIGGIASKNDNKMLGYNIKLENVTSSNTNRVGAWVGKLNDSKTTIQFAGVGIYGSGFATNVGSGNATTSFVFADYTGVCESYDTINNPVSSLNCADHSSTSTTHVEMPKYPYVNISPQSSMGTGEYISGDGAVLFGSNVSGFTGTGSKTMAAKIYSEHLTSGTAKQYYNTYVDTAVSGSDKINAYMNRSTTDDGDRISNYYDEKGFDTAQSFANFACVVIANNNENETTELINRYAQLVTNTTTDYAGTDNVNPYFDIEISTCKLVGGRFVVDTTRSAFQHGLSYSEGKLNLNGAYADSLSTTAETFTLVDLKFKDPLDTTKVAYHLYIPVYTIKEIEVNFSAAVMNGTNSVSYANGTETNPYAGILAIAGSNTHVDNLNTWFTTYIRYTYSRDDIQALLESGNINWNHNKIFYIDKYANNSVSMLPANTYMILVDPNGDHDKKYQVLLNSTDFAVVDNRITFDLTKFKDSSNNAFSESTFNELIARKITVSENAGNNGKYNLYQGAGTPSNTGDTHYVYVRAADGTPTYYQYVVSGGRFDLTLPAGDIYENYYISMFVPGTEQDSTLYGYYIRTPDSFGVPTYPSGTNNAVTKSAKVNCVYVGNNETGATTINRQVYIGNVFNQNTELTVLPHDLEIDGGNHTLNIYATTRITPKNPDVFSILSGINPDIYHSFNVFLDRKGENGEVTNEISGLVHDVSDPDNIVTDIQAWYSVNTAIPIDENANMTGFTSIAPSNIDLEKNYINVVTVNGGQTVLNGNGVTIYSRVKLDFGDYESEFPQKAASDTGVSVRASSNLSYDPLNLAFSNMSAPVEEPTSSKHIYYRQSLSSAKLKYYAATEPDTFDTDGLPSENLSRLGISGLYSMNTYMPVNTTAQYNVQNIDSALNDANSLNLTLSLQKKTDEGTAPYSSARYQNVSNLNSYWGAVIRDANNEVYPNDSGAPVTASGTNLRIQCGTYDQIITVPANTTTFTFSIPKEDLATNTPGYKVDENGYINIHVGFNAKTGNGFTEYANYKVNLSVKLMNDAEDIAGSYADDYLIYTNAKVNHDFLKH